MIIKNVNLVMQDHILNDHYIQMKSGNIEAYGPSNEIPRGDNVYDAKHGYLLPGAIDIHIHGTNGVDAMDASNEFLRVMGSELPKTGTTSFLATTMTTDIEEIRRSLTFLADAKTKGAELIGIHLEGPFINDIHKGAQHVDFIKEPDVALMQKCMDWSNDRIKIVTFAPERDADFHMLKWLTDKNIIASAGHSDATYEVLKDANRLGLSHITHFFNSMRGLHHREAGVVGFGFLEDVYVELIADKIHVSEDAIRLAFNVIGPNRLMLITDAMKARGLEDGEYSFGGQPVVLKSNEARLTTGSLAGSVLSMSEAVKNLKEVTGCGWSDIAKMTAVNQATSLRLTDRGAIKIGLKADVVLYDLDAHLVATFIDGQQVY